MPESTGRSARSPCCPTEAALQLAPPPEQPEAEGNGFWTALLPLLGSLSAIGFARRRPQRALPGDRGADGRGVVGREHHCHAKGRGAQGEPAPATTGRGIPGARRVPRRPRPESGRSATGRAKRRLYPASTALLTVARDCGASGNAGPSTTTSVRCASGWAAYLLWSSSAHHRRPARSASAPRNSTSLLPAPSGQRQPLTAPHGRSISPRCPRSRSSVPSEAGRAMVGGWIAQLAAFHSRATCGCSDSYPVEAAERGTGPNGCRTVDPLGPARDGLPRSATSDHRRP